VSACHYCNAQVLWVVLDTGARMPVEPIATPKGNVAVLRTSAGLVGYVIARHKPLSEGYDTYMPHKAVCKPEKGTIAAKDRPPSLFDEPADVMARHREVDGRCPLCGTVWPCAAWVTAREDFDAEEETR
jgi:hypothetical protein